MIICFLLFISNPAEAATVLDNLANMKPVTDITVPKGEKDEKKLEKGKNSDLKPHEAEVEYNAEDLELLARLVHAEAQGEPYKGKVAVAATVLNRVKNPDYPDTIRGVIYQNYYGFQYCPVRNGRINRPADEEARKAAKEALEGNDPTNGALSFYNPSKSSNIWIGNRPRFKTIGNHVFVK
jgi:spore germination cell wall hydrolase CwlJ-like protein